MDVGAVDLSNWSTRVAAIDPEAMFCFAVIDAAFCLGECGPEHLKGVIDQIVLAQAYAAPGYPGAVDADFAVTDLGSAAAADWHPNELAGQLRGLALCRSRRLRPVGDGAWRRERRERRRGDVSTFGLTGM